MGGVGTVFAGYSPPVNGDGRRLGGVSLERQLLLESGVDMEDPHALARYMMGRKYQEEWVRRTTAEAERDRQEVQLYGTRQLQAAFTMAVTFNNCIWRRNRQGSTTQGGIPILGTYLALTPFNPTVFNNCSFEDNLYDGSDGNQNGYAIQSVGSKITLTDSCFSDNSYIGFGPVQCFGGAEFEGSGNHITQDDLIICDFVALSNEFVPESVEDITCRTYDLEECGGEERVFPAPTSAPTPMSGAAATTDSFSITRSAAIASLAMWFLAIQL